MVMVAVAVADAVKEAVDTVVMAIVKVVTVGLICHKTRRRWWSGGLSKHRERKKALEEATTMNAISAEVDSFAERTYSFAGAVSAEGFIVLLDETVLSSKQFELSFKIKTSFAP